MAKEKKMQIDSFNIAEKQETRQERLDKLRGFLADELKSNKPSVLYVEDLKTTIEWLTK